MRKRTKGKSKDFKMKTKSSRVIREPSELIKVIRRQSSRLESKRLKTERMKLIRGKKKILKGAMSSLNYLLN
jgi:hypothetical protein